jgi:hypothetical protein
VAEGVAADLVGHEKPNINYNVYSGGSSIEQLSHAVEVLEQRQQDVSILYVTHFCANCDSWTCQIYDLSLASG